MVSPSCFVPGATPDIPGENGTESSDPCCATPLVAELARLVQIASTPAPASTVSARPEGPSAGGGLSSLGGGRRIAGNAHSDAEPPNRKNHTHEEADDDRRDPRGDDCTRDGRSGPGDEAAAQGQPPPGSY